MKPSRIFALLSVGFLAVSCGQVNAVVDQAGQVANKAGICGEALGIGNINFNAVDPAKLRDQALEKAERLRKLGEQASDADLQQTLFKMADSYVSLQKEKVEQLGSLTDWIKRNSDNIGQLQKAC